MKASYRWIKALVPQLDVSAKELAERFTRAGLEVEALAEYGEGTAPVMIAEVRQIEPHPKRDKLRLVTVDRGGALQRVVCGASNVPDPGGLVALAPLGATLPAVNMTLTPRDIGGVVSEGMLCSEIELGLVNAKKDEDHGILTLAPGFAKAGTPLREALPGVHDWILDISVTPNRPDALGHIGLAREAAALFGLPFAPPPIEAPARVAEGAPVSERATVIVEDAERCPFYGASMVLDVKIGPSPLWLKWRLESLGIRSISNVVDLTNLILLEWGQPMHAFDFDLVRGGKIVVRRARDGEPMETLDGVKRTLTGDDLVIADGEGPVALAGVMGGANSEIRAETKRVLLECAYFSPRGVRRASRRHAIHTESSHRFERGIDPGATAEVLTRATALLTQLAGGAAVPGFIHAGSAPPPPKAIPLRSRRMNTLLGAPVPFAEATQILGRLGFQVSHVTGEGDEASVGVVPPTHRPDIFGEADLIEEVVRVRGLDTVPARLPAIKPQPPRDAGLVEARVRRAALEVGLSEAITYGFVSPQQIAALGLPPAPIVLKNPLGEERSVMRTTLLPGLLEALGRARRHGVGDVRLFTVGSRFLAPSGAANDALGATVDEVLAFAAVIAGERGGWLKKPEPVDVYDAKGLAIEIVERATGRRATVAHQPEARRAPYLHPRGAGDVLVDGAIVGAFGPLHPDAADALDLGGPAFVVELDFRALAKIGFTTPKFTPIPVLPASTRDIALVVHDDVEAGVVAQAIREAAGDLCESVELFDLFRGGAIPADHRSLAFHVVYRDPRAATDPEKARTLTDDEVDKRHRAAEETVKQRFGATLRA